MCISLKYLKKNQIISDQVFCCSVMLKLHIITFEFDNTWVDILVEVLFIYILPTFH